MSALYLLARIFLALLHRAFDGRARSWERRAAALARRADAVRAGLTGAGVDAYAVFMARLAEAAARRDRAEACWLSWSQRAESAAAWRRSLAGWRGRNAAYLAGVKDAALAAWAYSCCGAEALGYARAAVSAARQWLGG